MVNFPAGKEGTTDVPLFALAVGRQDESALACSDQYPHLAHHLLLRRFCFDPSGCCHCHCPDLGNSGVWSRSFHRRRTSASTSSRCFSIFSMTAQGASVS